MYTDWWYLWSLSYFAEMHAYVLIVLKKSLKWVPIIGWVSGPVTRHLLRLNLCRECNSFGSYSWQDHGPRIGMCSTHDYPSWLLITSCVMILSHRRVLISPFQTTTSERPEDDEPLNFMIFPEGTLISKDTYPISKKYADKMGFVS